MFRCYSYTIIRERIRRCILVDYFNNCKFSKLKLIRSLIMV